MNFHSAEDVLREIVLHVDVVSFESVHEIGDLNSWFHWRSTSLEIWSTDHSALWLERSWVLKWRFEHIILHWSSWSVHHIILWMVNGLLKVFILLLLWRLELKGLLCSWLLPGKDVLILKSIHTMLAWLPSLFVHQWEEFSVFSLNDLSHGLVQEVLSWINWLLNSILSASAGALSLVELGIYHFNVFGVDWREIISDWVLISIDDVVLTVDAVTSWIPWGLLLKSASVWLWHLAEVRLLWLIHWNLAVLLVSKVWRSSWIIGLWLLVNLNYYVLHIIIFDVISIVMVLIEVIIGIFNIIDDLRLWCSILEGVKSVLLLLIKVIIILLLLSFLKLLEIKMSDLVLFDHLLLQLWNFMLDFVIWSLIL